MPKFKRLIRAIIVLWRGEVPEGFIRDDFYQEGLATCVDPNSKDYGTSQVYSKNNRGDICYAIGWEHILDYSKIHYQQIETLEDKDANG